MKKGDIILIGGLNEKIATIKQEKPNNVVVVEKKVFDVLQKNNLDLMERLEIAKEALRFYADDENFCINMDGGIEESDGSFIGTRARKTLKELENDE